MIGFWTSKCKTFIKRSSRLRESLVESVSVYSHSGHEVGYLSGFYGYSCTSEAVHGNWKIMKTGISYSLRGSSFSATLTLQITYMARNSNCRSIIVRIATELQMNVSSELVSGICKDIVV